MHCPNCGARYICPCSSCTKRHGIRKGEWKRPGGDLEQCPQCGFTEDMNWWAELEMHVYWKMEQQR